MKRKITDFNIGKTIQVQRKNKKFTPVKITEIKNNKIFFESAIVHGSLQYDSNKIKIIESYWPFKPGVSEIWYSNNNSFRDLSAGYQYNLDNGTLPDINNLNKTHVLLGTIDETDKSKIFDKLQGHNWSPNGEARDLIQSKELKHTSMSVGDIIKIGNKVYMVDMLGFIDLTKDI